jgi:hypothetical protein
MNARRLMLVTLTTLCTALGGLLLSGAGAQAEITHNFLGSFGPAGPGSGAFSSPRRVAVDQSTGDVYVYDLRPGAGFSYNALVYKFNSLGEPANFSALGTNVIEGVDGIPGFSGFDQIAVDSSAGPAKGDIYVTEGQHVTVYGEDGAKLGELNSEVEAAGGHWSTPCGVAVAPTGQVYVGLSEGYVNKYVPATNPVSNGDYASSMAGLGEDSCNLAADSEGNVYVAKHPEGPVKKYEALQFGSPEASGTLIDEKGGTLAVDPAGSDDELYVDEGHDIAQYDSSGDLLGRFGSAGAGALEPGSHGLAVDHSSGEVYISSPVETFGSGVVDIYSPDIILPDAHTEAASHLQTTSATLNGVVNPDGEGSATCQFEYATSSAYEETGSYGQNAACAQTVLSGTSPVAVTADLGALTPDTTYHYRLAATNKNGTNDSQDAIFTTPGPPTIQDAFSEGVAHTSATLEALINPGGLETHYRFEYGLSTAYGTSVPVPDGIIAAGFADAPVSANLTGLSSGVTYHFRIVAVNADSPTPIDGPDGTFTTVPPARIEGEAVSAVSAESATLQASIDPLGTDTHYYFQYGTSSCAANPSPCTDVPSAPGTDIGSGESFEALSTHLQGLASDTTYHYRVVASNTFGSSAGPERTFRTQQASGGELVLPDNRAWELVSPPSKNGASIESLTENNEENAINGETQAAADGSRIAYVASAPIGEAAGNITPEKDQVLSTRGPNGWSTQSITPPSSSTTSLILGIGSEYRLFSPDLSLGLLEPRTVTPLAPEASEGTIYLRDDASGDYLPLATAENTPAGTNLSETTSFDGPLQYPYNVHFAGASVDLKHVVFESTAALTSNAVKNGGTASLYDWTAGQLALVSVLPGGKPADAEGEQAFLGDEEQGNEVSVGQVRHAVSNDGSRIVWNNGELRHLYMRDMARAETIQLDVAQGTPEPALGEAHFKVASSDGSRVFFTDGQKLTPNSTAAGEGETDLYEFEVTSGSNEPLAGKLTDLTVFARAHEVREATDVVLGASEDGAYVYIGATGVLAQGGSEGVGNLYVLHNTGTAWTTTFVATFNYLGSFHDRVSPDGRYLAFESADGISLYDVSTGRVVCASCSMTGEGGAEGESRLPPWTHIGISIAAYQSRYLSDNGRLFFDSSAALVPQDTNGQADVYEFEPQGVGSCASSNETFNEESGGCIGLISSGTSSEESSFLDASEDGEDVFFVTKDRLVSQDYDNSVDIYDARVCSAAEPCASAPVAPPACSTTDSCEPAPSLQPAIFGASGSATFSGAGNIAPPGAKPKSAKPKSLTRAQKLSRALKACRKSKQKHTRTVCEARARKRYAPTPKAKRTKASKSSSSRARG